MIIRILWIEDAAYDDLDIQAGYMNSMVGYSLDLATSISDALEHIYNKKYDIIIFDIRVPPGRREEWRELYLEHGATLSSAKLGLHLIQSLSQDKECSVVIHEVPSWINTKYFGVLTAEPKLSSILHKLNIENYMVKTDKMEPFVLAALVHKIEKKI